MGGSKNGGVWSGYVRLCVDYCACHVHRLPCLLCVGCRTSGCFVVASGYWLPRLNKISYPILSHWLCVGCCIYSAPKVFGESSSESEDSDDGCHELKSARSKKKKQSKKQSCNQGCKCDH